MEQATYTAILVKATDYRENDKLVRLLTLQDGVITAVMKGVKKNSAKLKFAAQPFAFCEYEIVKRNDFYTVTGAAAVEDFFALTRDIDKFVYASVMLEAADCVLSAQKNTEIFVMILKAFKQLLYSDYDGAALCSFFLERLTNIEGLKREISFASSHGEEAKAQLKLSIKNFERNFSYKFNSAKFI